MNKERQIWEFLLEGDIHDFRNLSEQPCTSLFNVYGGINEYLDCRNDDFRMTTLFCHQETDARTAWQYGYALINLFNGASILLNRDYYKASIIQLIHNNRTAQHFMSEHDPELVREAGSSPGNTT